MSENNGNNGNNGETFHGSKTVLKEVLDLSRENIQKPPPNLEYIEAIASTKGRAGESDIRNLACRDFDHTNSHIMERGERLSKVVAKSLRGLQIESDELCKTKDSTRRYVQNINPNPLVWTWFATLEASGFGAFSLIVLIFGVMNIAQVLHGSGIQGFEEWWRCYTYSMIPPVLAVAVKGLAKFISNPETRWRFAVGTLCLGLLFGIIWLILFAQVFRGMTQSTAEIIKSLSLSDSPSESGGMNWFYIVMTGLAEMCLASGCWFVVEKIVADHRPSVMVEDPGYRKVVSDLENNTSAKAMQEDMLGRINGRMISMDDARKAYIEECVGTFLKVVHASRKTVTNAN